MDHQINPQVVPTSFIIQVNNAVHVSPSPPVRNPKHATSKHVTSKTTCSDSTTKRHTHIVPNLSQLNSPIPILDGPAPLEITCGPLLSKVPSASSSSAILKSKMQKYAQSDKELNIWTPQISHDMKERYDCPKKGSRSPRTWMKLLQKHRESERSRHHGLNASIAELSRLIPGYVEGIRETKIVKLQRIINYICHLEGHIQKICQEMGLVLDFKHLFLSPHVSANSYKGFDKSAHRAGKSHSCQSSQETQESSSQEELHCAGESLMEEEIAEHDTEIYQDIMLAKSDSVSGGHCSQSSSLLDSLNSPEPVSSPLFASRSPAKNLSQIVADIFLNSCENQRTETVEVAHLSGKMDILEQALAEIGEQPGGSLDWLRSFEAETDSCDNAGNHGDAVPDGPHHYVIHDEELQQDILATAIPLFGSQFDTLTIDETEREDTQRVSKFSGCKQKDQQLSVESSHNNNKRKMDDLHPCKRKKTAGQRATARKYTKNKSPKTNSRKMSSQARKKKTLADGSEAKKSQNLSKKNSKKSSTKRGDSKMKNLQVGSECNLLSHPCDIDFDTERSAAGILKQNSSYKSTKETCSNASVSVTDTMLSNFIPYEWKFHNVKPEQGKVQPNTEFVAGDDERSRSVEESNDAIQQTIGMVEETVITSFQSTESSGSSHSQMDSSELSSPDGTTNSSLSLDGIAANSTGYKVDHRKTSWMNGFMMFSRITRRKFIEDNPGMHTSNISKLMGQTWRAMSPDEQQPYRDKAKEYVQYMVRSRSTGNED